MVAPGACSLGQSLPSWEDALDDLLAPFHVPRHPLLYGAYALPMAAPATVLARTLFPQ
jgi:hypothetical protein